MKKLPVLAAIGVAALCAIPAASASAAVPLDASGCANDTCIYLAGNSGGTALIQAWAYTYTFTGHFYLSGPGVSQTSPTKTWDGHKGNYWSTSVTGAQKGQYCVAGYTSGGTYEGTACETLS